jgi:hypothetical protein
MGPNRPAPRASQGVGEHLARVIAIDVDVDVDITYSGAGSLAGSLSGGAGSRELVTNRRSREPGV